MKVKDKNSKMKKYVVIISSIIMLFMYLFIGASCSSCDRMGKSCASDIGGGLDRIVNIYDYEGDKIASYEGQIDVQENDTKVLFDLNEKRYVYYNCLVEVIEK